MPRWEILEHELKSKLGLKKLVGRSPAFMSVVERIPVLAQCDATVLIGGETGTGKEVFARMVHYLSPRSASPFVPVNCGAIPLELVENELFGHERAAYTGASISSRGLVREAEGGTLFLDEVDCLPLGAQVKMLRFLQEKEYRPLGSAKTRTADVRLITATNADVERAVEEGRLRQDLYYRLNVLPLELPPLRERHEDIPLLARHFAARYAAERGTSVPEFSEGAMQALLLYRWPGNVRELEHVVERAVVMSQGHGVLRRGDVLMPPRGPREPESFREAKARMVACFERSYVEKLLLAYHGNISRAARAARKNRRAFWELIRKYQIDARRFRRTS